MRRPATEVEDILAAPAKERLPWLYNMAWLEPKSDVPGKEFDADRQAYLNLPAGKYTAGRPPCGPYVTREILVETFERLKSLYDPFPFLWHIECPSEEETARLFEERLHRKLEKRATWQSFGMLPP